MTNNKQKKEKKLVKLCTSCSNVLESSTVCASCGCLVCWDCVANSNILDTQEPVCWDCIIPF